MPPTDRWSVKVSEPGPEGYFPYPRPEEDTCLVSDIVPCTGTLIFALSARRNGKWQLLSVVLIRYADEGGLVYRAYELCRELQEKEWPIDMEAIVDACVEAHERADRFETGVMLAEL